MLKNILIICSLLLMAGYACKEKYNPDYPYPNTGYLVVEGFINSGKGATTVRLSRTSRLTDTSKSEVGAVVSVEGSDNSRYPLTSQGSGIYSNAQLTLDRSKKFRLHIRTSAGKEYFSDYASPISTPPIDSVNFTREAPGLVFHINTHDPQNKTWYYTWNYEETWEINAKYYPKLKYAKNSSNQIVGVAFIYPSGNADTTRFRCWQFENSSSILIGSSIKLSKDIINLPINSIAFGSSKVAVLYSLKVYQHGVSAQGYDFLSRMKKNTQQVGSIFDAQPSELNGNIHNVADPTEVVVGFIDVSDAQELRIFVDPRVTPLWSYFLPCEEYMVPQNVDSIRKYSYLDPVEFRPNDIGVDMIFAVSPICDDCTSQGINRKPSYWPY